MSAPPTRAGLMGVAVAVALLHALNDAYTAFLPPLLPRIMDELGLTITLAAALMTSLALGSSLAQPLMGRLADRHGRRALVVLGPVTTGTFLSLMGWAPGFAALVGILLIGGLGSAAFHPPAASLAARVGERGRVGMRHALFSFGGAFGHALGPLIAVSVVAAVGLGGLWIAAIPVLVVGAAAWFVLPPGASDRILAPPPSAREIGRILRGPLGLVFGISATGAFLNNMFLTLQPISMAAAGATEARGAVVLSVYMGGQAVGTLAGGWLSDRMDRPLLLAVLCGGSFPLHLLAFLLPAGGPLALTAAVLAGASNMAVLPPIVVTAIELAPSFVSTSSGIVMGLAWAVGALGVLAAGATADWLGPRWAAVVLSPVILGGAWLALHLRRRGVRAWRPVEAA